MSVVHCVVQMVCTGIPAVIRVVVYLGDRLCLIQSQFDPLPLPPLLKQPPQVPMWDCRDMEFCHNQFLYGPAMRRLFRKKLSDAAARM